MTVRAAVFDLDGTLVHSAPSIAIAVNQILAEAGRPPLALEPITALIGDGAPTLISRAFAMTGPPISTTEVAAGVARYIDLLVDRPLTPADLYPGVDEALARLAAAGWKLGVCTNKPYKVTVETLEWLGIAARFGAVIGGDTLAQRKPAAQPLLAAIARLGARRTGSVMVGDSANDIGTARAANVPVVVVSFGYPRMPIAALGADRVIDRFSDLPAVLDLMVPAAS